MPGGLGGALGGGAGDVSGAAGDLSSLFGGGGFGGDGGFNLGGGSSTLDPFSSAFGDGSVGDLGAIGDPISQMMMGGSPQNLGGQISSPSNLGGQTNWQGGQQYGSADPNNPNNPAAGSGSSGFAAGDDILNWGQLFGLNPTPVGPGGVGSATGAFSPAAASQPTTFGSVPGAAAAGPWGSTPTQPGMYGQVTPSQGYPTQLGAQDPQGVFPYQAAGAPAGTAGAGTGGPLQADPALGTQGPGTFPAAAQTPVAGASTPETVSAAPTSVKTTAETDPAPLYSTQFTGGDASDPASGGGNQTPPPGAIRTGTDANGQPVYTTPDGRAWTPSQGYNTPQYRNVGDRGPQSPQEAQQWGRQLQQFLPQIDQMLQRMGIPPQLINAINGMVGQLSRGMSSGLPGDQAPGGEDGQEPAGEPSEDGRETEVPDAESAPSAGGAAPGAGAGGSAAPSGGPSTVPLPTPRPSTAPGGDSLTQPMPYVAGSSIPPDAVQNIPNAKPLPAGTNPQDLLSPMASLPARATAAPGPAPAPGLPAPQPYTGPLTGRGQAGFSPRLRQLRAPMAQQIAANPALHERLLRIMYNEQGSNPRGTQAVAESLLNRASLRGTPVAAQARWHGVERGGYYAPGNGYYRAGRINPRTRAILNQSLSNALAGSNISGGATDNASGRFGRNEINSGKFRFASTYGNEIFSSPGWGEPHYEMAYRRWYPTQIAMQ